MNIVDLLDKGIPRELVEVWKAQGFCELTPCQEEVLSYSPLWTGTNLIVVAPTSAGKTFVGEVLAAQAALSLHKAIFLVPFKAIAEEKYADFRERYGDLGISVVISDGDHNQFDQDIRLGNFGLAIIVYEKLAQLLVQSPGILADCHLLVVDEVQLIGDENRGPTLEVLLAHVLQQREAPQIIGLSATLDDLGGLDEWLQADVITSLKRPVPLWESVAWPHETSSLVNYETGAKKKGPALAATHHSRRLGLGSLIEQAHRLISSEGHEKNYLLFRTRVDDTIATAQQLAYVLPVYPVPGEVRDRLAELEETRLRTFLDRWIDRRIAYHNSGLSLEERRLVECLFRDGVIHFLVTTSTLAAGVNMPADIVVVLDYKRWDQTRQTSMPISVEEYKNSVGRAGRFGIVQEGRAYILTQSAAESNLVSRNFLNGRPRRLRSAIPRSTEPAGLVLGVIARGLVSTKSDIRRVFRNSFAYNYSFDDSHVADSFLTEMLEAVNDLVDGSLLLDEHEDISVTPLGRVAATSGLSLRSFAEMVGLLKSHTMNPTNGEFALQAICGFTEMQHLRPYDAEGRAALLTEWISGTPVGQIADRYSNQYSVGHGHIRAIGSTASWLMRTAQQMVDHLNLSKDCTQLKVALEEFATRCQYGVPLEMVPAASLQVLRRSDVMQLSNNAQGRTFTSLHEILDAPSEEFVGILAPQQLDLLKKAIEDQIGDSLGRRRTGHLRRADKLESLRPLIQRVYDCTGEEFERALHDLFASAPFAMKVRRFSRQPNGQPDLEITGTKGTIVVSATASINGLKPINWKKAQEVMASVGYSGVHSNFVCIGRPEFHDVAVGNATEISDRGDRKLLLMPLPALAELCLQEAEGGVSQGTVLRVLEDQTGHHSGIVAE